MKKRTATDKLRAKIWIEGIRVDTGMNFNQMDLLFCPQTRVRQSTLKPIQNGRFAKMFRDGILPDSGVSRDSAPGLIHEVDRVTNKNLSYRLFLPIWELLPLYSDASLFNWPYFLDDSLAARRAFYGALPQPLRIKVGALFKLAAEKQEISEQNWNDFWEEVTLLLPDSIDQLALMILLNAADDLASESSMKLWQRATIEVAQGLRADAVFGPHTDELLELFLRLKSPQ
jgi:hypothetical protein